MKKRKTIVLSILMASALTCASCAGKPKEQAAQYSNPPITGQTTDDTLNNSHEEITKELISIVNHNPELKAMLEKSIAQAKEMNPDKNSNPTQTLDEYYDYIDWAAKAMPWSILPGVDKLQSGLYDRIDQSLDYFYFINDQPLKELEDQGYYNNSIQYVEPYRSWLVNFTAQYGQYLNTTDSWCDDYYKEAKADESFHLNDDTYESPDNWKTFNQFFARYLSSPDKRPVTAKEDNSVIVSPADSQPQGVWKLDENSNIIHEEGVAIKSGIFTSVSALLADSQYKDAFANGTLTHTFLDVNDYHRYHFPVSGTVKEVQIIPGDDAAGGITTWDAEKNRYILKARTPGWQMIETRGCVIVDTEEYGLVAILPIGMSQVSSVNFEDTVKEGAKAEKGDMLGCFLFGGSDIVMVFQEGASFDLTAPKKQDGSYEHINMGTEYGVFRSQK